MNTIAPKELFIQGNSPLALALSEQVKQPALRYGTVYALAEMVTLGASKEQLDGARIFADILLNLGEKAEKIEPFPVKQVD